MRHAGLRADRGDLADTGTALESAAGQAFDLDALRRWDALVREGAARLGWPAGARYRHRHASGATLATQLEHVERTLIADALRRQRGDVVGTAQALGIAAGVGFLVGLILARR